MQRSNLSPDMAVSDCMKDFMQRNRHIEAPIRQLLELYSFYLSINKEFQKELLDLKRKFQLKYDVLYMQRSAIVNAREDEAIQPTSNPRRLDTRKTALRGIPEFWLVAMQNNPKVSEMIQPKDEAVLRYLYDIRIEYLDDPQAGFRLCFCFEENEYFTNETLTKTFIFYYDHKKYTHPLTYGEAIGDDIRWKDGMDLTRMVEWHGNSE
jgi:nucleosome assembly protein 1-like 1